MNYTVTDQLCVLWHTTSTVCNNDKYDIQRPRWRKTCATVV